MPPDVDWRVMHCGMMCRASRFCFSNTLNEFRNGQLRSTHLFSLQPSRILRYIVLNCIKHSHTECGPCKTHDCERHCQHHICNWTDWILKKYLPNNGRRQIQIFFNLLRTVCMYKVIILRQAMKVQLCFFFHSLFCCPFDYSVGSTFSAIFYVKLPTYLKSQNSPLLGCNAISSGKNFPKFWSILLFLSSGCKEMEAESFSKIAQTTRGHISEDRYLCSACLAKTTCFDFSKHKSLLLLTFGLCTDFCLHL